MAHSQPATEGCSQIQSQRYEALRVDLVELICVNILVVFESSKAVRAVSRSIEPSRRYPRCSAEAAIGELRDKSISGLLAQVSSERSFENQPTP